MGDYRVFETRTYQEELTKISRSGLPGIKEKLQEHIYPQIRTEPHFGPHIKRLKHWDPPTWRYLVGAWRFFYEIHERERSVYMTAAEHRGRAYK